MDYLIEALGRCDDLDQNWRAFDISNPYLIVLIFHPDLFIFKRHNIVP